MVAGFVAGYACRALLVWTSKAVIIPATASTIITAGK